MKLEINGTDAQKRTFKCVMTAEVVDREGEVVLLDGLDMAQYTANPVVLFSHGRDGTAGKIPVGRMKNIERVGNQIHGEGEMATRPESLPANEEWLPDTLLSLMQQKCLNAVSIGFVPKESRRPTAQEIKMYGKTCDVVTTKAELVELSLEPTPANQAALITMVGKGLIPKKSKAIEPVKHTLPVKIKAKKHVIRVETGAKLERAKEVIMVRVKGGLYA